MSTTNLFFFIGAICGIAIYSIWCSIEIHTLYKKKGMDESSSGKLSDYVISGLFLHLFFCMFTAFICGFLFHLLVNFIPN
ncbi:MAG: hypothetical protein CBC38_03105 [Gammaproteobacteria bacterium TMED78]|nr:MAG: hypothetical protein CBC38_03105 [Gammaproteobacteria bacterium TMED78]